MTINSPPSAPLDTRVTPLTLANLFELWSTQRERWSQSCPFVSPPWLAAWWRIFGQDYDAFLLQVAVGGRLAGVAPLMIQGKTALFMGSADLCDQGDFMVVPNAQKSFFEALLHHLVREGIQRLVLTSTRPDSSVQLGLAPIARAHGCRVTVRPNGVSLQMPLPGSWDDYLNMLDGKQRHEVRRKFRRVADAGVLGYHTIRDVAESAAAIETFVRLFRLSRSDKRRFMTPQREAFFLALAEGLARADMLSLLSIEIDNQPAAAVFCLDFGQTTYLYNNGFDPQFRGISIGMISKLMTIQASIASGKQVYDFLNGAERYKSLLGGKEVPLSACVVEL